MIRNDHRHLPRQSEIKELEGRSQKPDVLGLEIPVGNIVGMDVFEGVCYLLADGEFFEGSFLSRAESICRGIPPPPGQLLAEGFLEDFRQQDRSLRRSNSNR